MTDIKSLFLQIINVNELDVADRGKLSYHRSTYKGQYEKTIFFANAKTKPQINCAVNAQLISTFVFTSRKV